MQWDMDALVNLANQEINSKRDDGKNILIQNISASEIATYKAIQHKYADNTITHERIMSTKKEFPILSVLLLTC
jgi:hypothetical protein